MDKDVLLAHVLGRDRAWLVAHPEPELTPEQRREYDALLARHASGEPVAYLTGEAWFYGRRFEVTPDVLIPRPETEHLIDEALAFLRAFDASGTGHRPVVVDVGTGSGAIACTIAAESPNAEVYATDRSFAALAVARYNAARLGLRIVQNASVPSFALRARHARDDNICFEHGDLLPDDAALKFDCVIANLPYIPSADVPLQPDPVGFEPREATDGGPDGLREYRRLLELLPSHVNAGGLVLLEAAPPTIGALRELAVAALPGARIEIGRDYAGLERYVKGWLAVSAER